MGRRGPHEGSIYERADGRWAAVVHVGYQNGRRVRRSFYAATRAEAAAKLLVAQRAAADGLPLPAARLTVAAYLGGWLAAKAPELRPATLRSYRGICKNHLVPALGRIRLAVLSPADVRRMLVAELAAGKSPRTVGYIRGVLRVALAQGVRDGLLPRNVAALAEPPRVPAYAATTLDPAQARTFLRSVADDRLAALYTVAVARGLRQGEALGLRWEEIDLDVGTLTVRAALQRVGGHLARVEPKSRTRCRTLPLPAFAVAALREHRRRQRQERLLAGSAWHETGYVFVTTIGTPLDGRKVTRELQAHLAAVGLPRLRFHDLRHSCASLLLAQGVNPRTVMELLGHSQVSLTLNLYSHVPAALTREAVDRLDTLLGAES